MLPYTKKTQHQLKNKTSVRLFNYLTKLKVINFLVAAY